jgi:hypothetical protein
MFGKIAIDAAKLCQSSNIAPKDAWQQTIPRFTSSPSLQNKCCPENIFLSLCSEGLVKDIPPGQYTKSKKLKEALAILGHLHNPNNAKLKDRQIWNLIKPDCVYNSEVAVVRALFLEDLINKTEPQLVGRNKPV